MSPAPDTPAGDPPATRYAPPPSPPSERRAWLLAGTIAAVGLAVLVLVLSGVVGGSRTLAPPAVYAYTATPSPGRAAPVARSAGVIVASPSGEEQALDRRRFASGSGTLVSSEWMEGFYPIYATAQSTFGVNWLLIASIHMQESAFSTAPSTYHGLNFAGCCGGPMQFNVTNGPVSTWDLVADSYIYGRRPAHYDHMTAVHPSIYDDFDSIMAAAHLLSADGAGYGLDGSAWAAAYDYYGHDETGVIYADQVLGRAIGWSQHGFCINCALPETIVQAVDAAYGAPVRAQLQQQAPVPRRRRRRAAAGVAGQGA